jgi:hypothetical protein
MLPLRANDQAHDLISPDKNTLVLISLILSNKTRRFRRRFFVCGAELICLPAVAI